MGEVIDDKKRRDRERREEKKSEEKREDIVRMAHDDAREAMLDSELIETEAFESELIDTERIAGGDIDSDAMAKHGFEKRQSYKQTFEVRDRGVAAWAARKISEARTFWENLKKTMRLETTRAERRFETRKEFFERKLWEWAAKQPRDTRKSIRLPEACVRLEFCDLETGGVDIFDAAELKSKIIEAFGVLEAEELGLIHTRYELDEGAARSWLSNPANREKVAEGLGYRYSPPETVKDGGIKIVRT